MSINNKPVVLFRLENHNINLDDLGLTKDQIVVIVMSGSRMYGTATANSDVDYLGIYIPTKEQLLLNNFPHHIPYKKDNIDLQIWSIHHFLKLVCKGETMAIDLLHAQYENWIAYNIHVWPYLVNHKKDFYTKNMRAFVSYARKQASKFGSKGNRIKELEKVIKFCKIEYIDTRLSEVWDYLPTGDHIHFINEQPIRLYQICGGKFQETVKIGYVLNGLEKLLTSYGKRANMAKDNKGVDLKALSHAIRSAEQVYWILKYGTFKYPLKNSKFIKQVKYNKIDFKIAIAVLEDYMTEIEKMMETSNLPETINKKVWDQWLVKLLENYLNCL